MCIRPGNLSDLARYPKSDFFREEERVPRFSGTWFENIARVAILCGERRKFFGVEKELLQPRCGWNAESEKDF